MAKDHWRRCLLGTCLVFLASSYSVSQSFAEVDPPNLLLVIADDMGLDASPCYEIGTDKPDMPVLESLCRDGIVFDNAWSNPTCSPTRATILTGRYGFRTGVLTRAGGSEGIGLGELSIQRLLDEDSATKYAHAVVGKWHLSDAANGGDDNPEAMGVGFYSGLIRGAVRDYYRFPLTSEGQQRMVDGYATTVFTDIAIEWLARQQEPWFLWLAYNAPHTPFHVPPPHLHERELAEDPTAIRANPLPYYLAALEALDHELGRLLDSLPTAQRDNTLIMFLGDNGSPAQVAQPPYGRGRAKGTLYPGGISVPLIVAGRGVRRAGEREAALVNTTDIFATLADLAGLGPDRAQDGVSFRHLLTDSSATSQRDWAYAEIEYDGQERQSRQNGWTVRQGDHQLLVLDNGGSALFDLASDPGGLNDLLKNPTPEAANLADRLRTLGEDLRASQQ